jgi:DNA-directed RNA polymerase subunit RPC12/RpoP
MAQNVLVLDIETSPNLAYVWGAWKQNVGVNQFIRHSEVMCYAAKWYGNDRIFTKSWMDAPERVLIRDLVALCDAADIIVTHNGKRFDIPVIRSRAVELGYGPFSPIKHVDTCLIAKRLFNFEMNKLAYIAEYLGVAPKDDHKEFPGFDLWKQCLLMNPKAWDVMKTYNVQDVITLEQVYEKLLPWMDDHPHVMVDNPKEPVCPKCGGSVQRRGFYFTQVSKYQRYRCNNCGGWSRSRYTENNMEERKNILANAV